MIALEEVKKRSIAGVISYAFRSFFLQGVALVASLLLAYYLSPEEFGVFFVVSSVIGLFTFLSDVGLAATLVQKKTEPTLLELRTTFTVQQVLASGIVLAIIGLTPFWVGRYELSDQGVYLLYALAFSFILASLKTIPSILLERELQFNKLVFPQIIENLVFYGMTVWFASQGYGLMSYVYSVWARGIIGVVVIYLLRPWNIGFAFSMSAFKSLLNFGMKFQLNDLFGRIKDDLLIVVMARFIPAAEMGYISWAKRWSYFPYQLTVQSVMSITFPTFARLQSHTQVLKRSIEKTVFFVSLFIFPALAGIISVAPMLLEIVPRYDKWTPALVSLTFFCLNIAWASISTPLINALNATGKISETMKLMLFWTGATWLFTPVLVYWFGYDGVAIASFLVACTSFLTIWLTQRYIPVRILPQVWRQLVASIIMYGVVIWVDGILESSFWNFALLILSGVGVYAGVISLLGFHKIKAEFATLLKKAS